MMTGEMTNLVGVGIYTVPDVARLLGVPARSIRRWAGGYSYNQRGRRRHSPPVWRPSIPMIDGQLTLSFLDLIEVRFVHAFRKHGVSWTIIRKAEAHAAEVLRTSHPFATNKFRTDGKTVLGDVADRTNGLWDMAHKQRVFADFVAPYLKGIEWADDGLAARWRPLDGSNRVVIDPRRSFGAPLLDRENVPTRVIFEACKSGESVRVVANWFEVPLESAEDAVRFERQIQAA